MTKKHNYRWEPGKPLKIFNTRQYTPLALYRIPAIEVYIFNSLPDFYCFCHVYKGYEDIFL